MGFYRIFVILFLMPLAAEAETLAQTSCQNLYRDLVESCDSFAFDNGDYMQLDMDRISLEQDENLQNLFSQSQFYFGGNRCSRNSNFNRLSFVFKQNNSSGDPQCAVWRHYRNGAGESMVEERIYRGSLQTHLQQFTEDQFSQRPRNAELALDSPQHNSFLNRLGRVVTPVFDAIGIGSSPEPASSSAVQQ